MAPAGEGEAQALQGSGSDQGHKKTKSWTSFELTG
jgi:hypothetical protein